MKTQGRIAILAALATCLALPAGFAQSTQPAQNQQDQQSAQSQNQDQSSGVSHPPPDSTIEADEDTNPAPNPAPPAKPSPAIPMTAAATPAASAPAADSSAAPASAAAASSTNPLDNTDYGIVTVVPTKPASTGDASLQTRGWNPNDDIVNYVPSGPNELAAGTNFTVRLSEDLSTRDTQRGESFRGVVIGNVYKEGRIIIPAGAGIRGVVTEVSQGHHIGPHATLRLRPEEIVLPDGTMYRIDAVAVETSAAGTRTNDEGGIVATHHYTKDAVEYGAGAGAGAATGALVAGPVGAGVGSLVGAGLVSTHMLIGHPEAASLPEGSLLVFSLTEPMSMTPTRN